MERRMLKALAMLLRRIPLSDPVVPIGLRTWCSAGRLRRFNGGGGLSNSVQKAHGRSEFAGWTIYLQSRHTVLRIQARRVGLRAAIGVGLISMSTIVRAITVS